MTRPFPARLRRLPYVVLVLMCLVAIGRLYANNAGAYVWSQMVFEAQTWLPAGTYPFYDLSSREVGVANDLTASNAMRRVTGMWLDPWLAGRLALAAGDDQLAAQYLGSAIDPVDNNPLKYQDVLFAISLRSTAQQVIDVYTADAKLVAAPTITDTLAWAYVSQGLAARQAGNETASTSQFQMARRWRPFDLLTNELLRQQAAAANQLLLAAQYRQTSTEFPLAAIQVSQDRFIGLVTGAVSSLLKNGSWSKQTAVRVAQYLVWQYYRAPEVEKLLRDFAESEPDEVAWPTNLGELYFRRGAWAQALAADRMAVGIDAGHLESIHRIGLIYERQGDLTAAADWYARYLNLAPHDPVVAADRLRVLRAQQRPESQALELQLQGRTDRTTVAAELLKVPRESIQLGDNELRNAEFEAVLNGQPRQWRAGDYATQSEPDGTPRAAVAGGVDAGTGLQSMAAVRIDSLWMRDGASGFYGFVTFDEERHTSYMVKVQAQHWYLMTGLYRTAGSGERGGVYLGNPTVSWFDVSLPATNRQWRRFFVLGCSTEAMPAAAQAVVRLYGTGQIWFSDLALVPVTTAGAAVRCTHSKSLVH